MDYSQTVRLLDSEEVPESRLLLHQVIDIVVVLVQGLNALEQTHRVVKARISTGDFLQLVDEPFPQFEVEVLWHFGAVDG